ncbi:MAG TPA: NAD(P)H-dependent oxidoreductase subunit E [Candidatus Tumulicola sp.]
MNGTAGDFATLRARLQPQCDAIIGRYEEKRSALLMLMHLFQQEQGFVSNDAIGAVSQMLDITRAETEGTVSFYTLLYRKPVGKYMLQPCRGLACAINGAEDIMAYFRQRLGVGHLETTADGLFSYEEVECLAACDRASCMQVNLEFVYDLTPEKIDAMLDAMRAGTYDVAPATQTKQPERTWRLRADDQVATGRKSPGARDVESPNNAGGVGDKSGIIMLDRIVAGETDFFRGTRERAVLDSKRVVDVVESEGAAERAGH